MSHCAAKKDYASLAKSVSHGLSATLFIALPSTIGLIAVANPLIRLASAARAIHQQRHHDGRLAPVVLHASACAVISLSR